MRTTIYAPVTGYIAKRSVQVGQQINPRQPLLAIVPLDQIWVDANYKENQLYRLRMGQAVTLALMPMILLYHGHIDGFSPGTGSAFALLPPQNALVTGLRSCSVCQFDCFRSEELRKHPLQIGLSITVVTYTRGLKEKFYQTR